MENGIDRSRVANRGQIHSNEAYQRLLTDRLEQARRSQTTWYDTAKEVAAQHEQGRLEAVRSRREAQVRAMEKTRQALINAQDEAEAIRQATIAAREEEERRTEERIQAQRRAEIAALEEEERRQREEEERRRRERERDCAVCLESYDMDLMLQLPCSHWYCPEHLRGERHP
jgi:hypothetical protein